MIKMQGTSSSVGVGSRRAGLWVVCVVQGQRLGRGKHRPCSGKAAGCRVEWQVAVATAAAVVGGRGLSGEAHARGASAAAGVLRSTRTAACLPDPVIPPACKPALAFLKRDRSRPAHYAPGGMRPPGPAPPRSPPGPQAAAQPVPGLAGRSRDLCRPPAPRPPRRRPPPARVYSAGAQMHAGGNPGGIAPGTRAH